MGLLDKFSGKNENKSGGLKQIIESAKPLLNLTPQQDEQITEIIKGFRGERKEFKSEGGDNMRSEIKSARQETMQKIKDVLNDDQKRSLEESIRKHRNESN